MKFTSLFFGLGVAAAATSAHADLYTYSSGHGDMGLGEGQELELHLHLESVGELEPDAAIIEVPYSTYAYTTGQGGRASGAAWDGLGVSTGESYWYLPASHSLADSLVTPFLGIGGEEIELGFFTDNLFSLTLESAVMPDGATFSVWTESLGVPTFLMTTADGIDSSDLITLDLDDADHMHVNWGFSEAGTYELTFSVSATEAISGDLQSSTATYTFNVVPEPSTWALLAGSAALGLILLRRRARGQSA
ncbi:MAG: choice-of-anchor M domain-containing protein [Puniceicoccales bacterium]